MSNVEAESPEYGQYQGDSDVDIAIIGGGLTGLWAAYFAKQLEPSLKVAVFEAERIGYGASGRNGGWVSALVPGNRKKFAKAVQGGVDSAKAFQREFISSVNTILATLEKEDIQADQHKGGTLSAAHTAAGLNRLKAKRSADLAYGLDESEVQLLSPADFQSRINIAGVHGGLYYPDVARVNPAKLVRGLAAAASRLGVDIYEHSRVISAASGLLSLGRGTVRTGKTFICTEGYSGPFLGKRRLIPINSSMIVTRPLDEAAWERIGWAGLECLNDSAHTFIYAQRTADNRIAIGGRGTPYRFASGTGGHGQTAASTVRQLTGRLESFFPGIRFEPEHAWSGVLGVTRDWNGGVNWDPAAGIGSSIGYAGHGVTAAFVGGRTLAELALDRNTVRTSLPWVGYRARNWEPEPVRWLGVHAMYKLFGIADSWEEARKARQTSLIAKFGSRLAGLHE
ncbi:NAD(P)/FAD-dependent oxidoreductase [Arthrobacter sp. GCM10027362]|uniref:NAD(P)/FAD-dependent oxidoreductase n=1 Tax=Arthrobacter sp. GCM10027362 TaxID=3273379 RepID=UPI003670A268